MRHKSSAHWHLLEQIVARLSYDQTTHGQRVSVVFAPRIVKLSLVHSHVRVQVPLLLVEKVRRVDAARIL